MAHIHEFIRTPLGPFGIRGSYDVNVHYLKPLGLPMHLSQSLPQRVFHAKADICYGRAMVGGRAVLAAGQLFDDKPVSVLGFSVASF